MSYGQTVWRITLWLDGQLWRSAIAGRAEAPSLEDCLAMFSNSPFAWSKVRAQSHAQ